MAKSKAWITIFAGLLTIGLCRSASAAPPQFDQQFTARGVIEADTDQARRAVPTAGCNAMPSSGPAICIADTDRRTYLKGEAIASQISWRNAPADASIIVYLERDADSPSTPYLGPVGPLVITPIPVAGTGERAFVWNGREFPCAPTHVPIICQSTAEIGRYRLRAALYDHRQVVTVGWHRSDAPLALVQSVSRPFVVQGTPDLRPIARSLLYAGVNEAMRNQGIRFSSIFRGDTHGNDVAMFEDEIGRVCASIAAHPPYLSTLRACVAKDRVIGDAGLTPIDVADGDVSGRVIVAPGAVSLEEAVRLAQDEADQPYLSRVAFRHQPQPAEAGYDHRRDGDFHAWSRRNPHATTSLSDSIGDTTYRPDLGGAWVIVVNEIMSGGSVPDDQRFADKVLVLVRPDRSACVIQTRPYRGAPFDLDLERSALACP